MIGIMADSHGNPEIVRLLLQAGADASARNALGFGSTPAELARKLRRPDIARLFENPQGGVNSGAEIPERP